MNLTSVTISAHGELFTAMAPVKPKVKSADGKRKIVRESMRKLREAIKSDPVRYEEAKKKERERYHARKAAGKIKGIADMSEREKRTIRRKWKDRSKRCYERKKTQEKLNRFLAEETPPSSPCRQPVQEIPAEIDNQDRTPCTSKQSTSSSRSRVSCGEKLRRNNRRKLNITIKKLEIKLQEAERRAGKYKKQVQRLKKIQNKTSPRTEVMSAQLKENYKSKRGSIQKRKFIDNITGPLIKKDRFMKFISSLSSNTILYGNRKNRQMMHQTVLQVNRSVRAFLLKDENSRLCPGKKDTITFKQHKMQKRYLNDTLKNLYVKFRSAHPEMTISYTTFCRMRPFWVLQPKVSARNTCLCLLHTNMNLIVSKLYYLKIINEKSPEDLVKSLTCHNGYLLEQCLERTCPKCKHKEIKVLDYDTDDETFYEKWLTKNTY
ncbi:unnamed protein product [Acanthoscelides obtectus]|uniref:Uncharacterized protein n=1 Tax=Acanthoscelides obtectus TaxID=200917 RepID=A0A9P0LE20_ACAOB|nr:unnamed protein product [Acanthoscelides obtectus]CAK1643827.1 hypothetical protein AOBTE_LOCUS13692 [Acanthoscelides obtectus]